MSDKKANFFYIRTWHGGWLGADRKTGRLMHIRPDKLRDKDGFVPLVGWIVGERLFLSPQEILEIPVKVKISHIEVTNPPQFGGKVLAFLMRKTGDKFGLADPMRPARVLSAHAFKEDRNQDVIFGDCYHLLGWEEFETVPCENPPEHLLSLPQRSERLLAEIHKPDFYLDLIKKFHGRELEYLADAVRPFTSWRAIERLGRKFVSSPEFRDMILRRFPQNIWTHAVLPELDRFLSDRRPLNEIVAPLEQAVIAYEAFTFSGFLQAFSFAARQAVTPQRRICMTATLRNEGIYVLEWIAYHRALGVEHFFLYTNDNEDGSDDLLRALAELDFVTVIFNQAPQNCPPQDKAYSHAFNVLADILDFEYCLVCDLDEFLTLNPQKYPRIGDYLDFMERWDGDGIALNWRFVASNFNENGLADLARPLTERNVQMVARGAIGEGWRLVKTIFRPHKVFNSRPHYPIWPFQSHFDYRLSDGERHDYLRPPPNIPRDPAFSDSPRFGDAFISHYYFKSLSEWVWKYSRNTGTDTARSHGVERLNELWAQSFVLQYELGKEGENDWIKIRAVQTAYMLRSLRENAAIRKAENGVRKLWSKRLKELGALVASENVAERLRLDWRYILDRLPAEIAGEIPLWEI